jgi:UDP-N-acetyl-D-glucosamine dehydrogenase
MLSTADQAWATSDPARDAIDSAGLLEMLMRRLDNKTAKIGIVCTGLAGLPFAQHFASEGYHTSGFNLDPQEFERLWQDESLANPVTYPRLAAHIANHYFVPQAGFSRVVEQDAILICVPDEIDSTRAHGLTFIRDAAIEISRYLRHGQLIVLEGTPAPHLADASLLSILEGSGLSCPPGAYGVDQQAVTSLAAAEPDFFLAFSPRSGAGIKRPASNHETPIIVAGVNGPSALAAQALYQSVFDQPILVKSSRSGPLALPAIAERPLRNM